MKLATPLFSHVLEVDSSRVHSVVIENRPCFRRFVESLYNAVEKGEEDIVVSRDGEILAASKVLELIVSYVPFTLNRKTLLQAVMKRLEKISLLPERLQAARDMVDNVKRYLGDLALELPYPVTFESVSIASLMKAGGVMFEEEEEFSLNKLLGYFRLVRTFDADRVMILVGLRSFFSEEELAPFFRAALQDQFKILLVDGENCPMLPEESRLLIDGDMCELTREDD